MNNQNGNMEKKDNSEQQTMKGNLLEMNLEKELFGDDFREYISTFEQNKFLKNEN